MNCWNCITRKRYQRKAGKCPAPYVFGKLLICAQYADPHLVLIPWKNSHGIMRQSGYPSLSLESTGPFLSVSSECLWRSHALPRPHVAVLARMGPWLCQAEEAARWSEACGSPSLCWSHAAHKPCCAFWKQSVLMLLPGLWVRSDSFLESWEKGSESWLCGCALRMLSLTWRPLSLEKHALPLNFCNTRDCLNHDGPL